MTPESPAPARLAIDSLTKRYGARTAIDGLSLRLAPGAFVALLGPNGAGKSTLFQVLTGLFAADAGDVQVNGLSLRQRPAAALRHIGVVFQQMSLDLDLSVERNLRFHADLHGLPRALAADRIAAGVNGAGLAADLQRPVRELSGGNRRKVELVRALLHQPALLLMDEPTVGLDPKSRRDLLATVRADMAARASSVLWATHLVEEAAQADRVLVLHQGRLLADGTPAEVSQALGGDSLENGFIRATSATGAVNAAGTTRSAPRTQPGDPAP
ncbi:ABC transporter ATP-binding protein [Aquabacterium sp. OR-4]|uniref:ABC transporter ATP-binding protein n=1 Tax=Aquabacterium sp. OR-4 TaxID=2978127 RepID=UPI0021B4A204|nr:ABC transporter ATP-binding protein [Aquabacterium sp. OR-4]MDT7837167.1 ABC transporter ATP-binding protein [Aquabacterium sp. OR-4]